MQSSESPGSNRFNRRFHMNDLASPNALYSSIAGKTYERQPMRVALDWTLDLLFGKDLVQFQTFRAPTISIKEEDTGKRSSMVSAGD
jgi:hypothetical protein